MANHPIELLQQHLSTVHDPRVERTREHDLTAILTIAVCAVVGGADSWVDIELFGNAKRDWFEQWLRLPNGIPSHDTFGRVFARIDPTEFQHSFLNWVGALVLSSDGQVIAVDGKTLCGSGERRNGRAPLHLVSAWATANGIVLGQQAVDAKSNEITAVPALLRLLDLTGAIVTLDALNCQTATAQQIVEGGADYILALKGNHPRLFDEVKLTFRAATDVNFTNIAHSYASTITKAHGRLEERELWLLTDSEYLDYLDVKREWPKLGAIGMLRSRRTIGEHTTQELRYYLLSISDATRANQAIRAHWGVENQLHWVLDVVFGEDASQVGGDHGAHNLAVLRHIALNLLKQHPAKLSIKSKRNKAGWDNSFLHQIVFGLDA
jgi:predicted transposase YbfD/YdcC